MPQPSERNDVVEVKPLLPSFLKQGDVVDDEDYPPVDDTKAREGIARLNAFLATLAPDKPYMKK